MDEAHEFVAATKGIKLEDPFQEGEATAGDEGKGSGGKEEEEEEDVFASYIQYSYRERGL